MNTKSRISAKERNENLQYNYQTRLELNEELFIAVNNGKIEEVEIALEKGANIHASHNGPDNQANEAGLTLASINGDKSMVTSLLEKGSNPQNPYCSALVSAATHGHTEIAKLLLDNGADIHYESDQAIKDAATNGHVDTVKLLIERGANLHDEEEMALRCAANIGQSDVVRLLLEHGADVHAHSDCALEWAAEEGHKETVKVLLENGANLHADHDSPLKRAAEEGEIEIVTLMLVDFNMTVKPETKAYLEASGCTEALKILNTRDLSNKLSTSMKPKAHTQKQPMRMKI